MISRIQNARFGTSWRERTYDEKEVDDFLDEVNKTLGEGHLPDPAKVRNAKFSVTGLLWPGYVIVDVDDLLDEIERYVGGLSRNGARCGDLPPRLGSAIVGGELAVSSESTDVRFAVLDEVADLTVHPSIRKRIGWSTLRRPW